MTSLSIPHAGLLLANGSLTRKSAAIVALVAMADWLFYGRTIGVSAVLFLLALDIGVVVANPVRAGLREMTAAAGILLAALIPLIVELSLISILFGAAGTAYFAFVAARGSTSWTDTIAGSVALLADAFWRAFPDLYRSAKLWARGERTALHAGALIVWIVPLALGGIFLLLFTSANPLIENWFAGIDLAALLKRIDFARIMFWLIMLSLAWPFVFVRIRDRLKAKIENGLPKIPSELPATSLSHQLFGKPAILRSLILFNALFAVQTALDAAYLWGDVALPAGVTYAAYAHRGAYPLILTALLAAAFVIAATKPGSEAEGSPLIRGLVFLWTGQNVLLVVSSILRLDLYVQIYSLTYWRVAAFIWMLLVALGLVLIVARIALGRSNSWLIAANLASLALTLYLCCFVNFPSLIANYNVRHSWQVSGKGEALDFNYLISLGPQAIPAMDTYISHRGRDVPGALPLRRNLLAASHLHRMRDWRAWSYRDWQLAHYLESNADNGGALW